MKFYRKGPLTPPHDAIESPPAHGRAASDEASARVCSLVCSFQNIRNHFVHIRAHTHIEAAKIYVRNSVSSSRNGEVKKRKTRKTVVAPRTRLLIEIALHGVENRPDYLAGLSRKIDYSAGSIKSQFLPDLLNDGYIESLDHDKQSPPYKATTKGKELLGPIFLVRTIGYCILILTIVAVSTLLYFYINNPILLVQYWFPSTLLGFLAISAVLILYPQIILKFGKKAF